MSQAGAKGVFLCTHTHTYIAHRLQPFIISLIPQLSLLGNQSVIHHYLSSAQKSPRGLLHIYIYIHAHTYTNTQLNSPGNDQARAHERIHARAHTHIHRHPGGVFAHLEALRDCGGEVITSSEGQTQDNSSYTLSEACRQDTHRGDEESGPLQCSAGVDHGQRRRVIVTLILRKNLALLHFQCSVW